MGFRGKDLVLDSKNLHKIVAYNGNEPHVFFGMSLEEATEQFENIKKSSPEPDYVELYEPGDRLSRVAIPGKS